MLKELNSVLAVRNVEKQRRRELRERKKQGGSTDAPLVSHSQPQADQEVTNNIQEKPVAMGCSQEPGVRVPVQEEVAPIIQIAEGDPKGKALVDDELLSPEKSMEGLENESHKFDLPLQLPSREGQWGNTMLNSSAIAQAVAAIALRTGRANKEEFFHDDQDSSSATSEAEADQP